MEAANGDHFQVVSILSGVRLFGQSREMASMRPEFTCSMGPVFLRPFYLRLSIASLICIWISNVNTLNTLVF